MAIDMDEVFSYRTTKEVRMLDRRLGMVCWLIRAVVLVYVVGYVFLYREGYAETEKGVGHVVSMVNGSTYSMIKEQKDGEAQLPQPRPWDAIDVAVPALQNGAAFIGTTVYITKEQTQKPGANPQAYCDTSAQCAGPTVLREASTSTKPKDLEVNSCDILNHRCWKLQWSPAYPLDTEEHALVSADELTIRLQPEITFPSLDESVTFQSINVGIPTIFAGSGVKVDPPLPLSGEGSDARTSSTVGGHNDKIPDLYKISDLLLLAGTSYDSIKGSGCTLAVEFFYDCFVDSGDCQPKMTVTRLDDNERHRGFHHQYAHYYRIDVGGGKMVTARDLYTAYGVRLLLSSQGKGKKVSLSIIVLQIAAAIALLWLAGFVADFLMLYVLPERKHYRTYKQERTPDFSDLRNKIDEVEGEKKKLRDRKNRFAAKLDES